MMIQPVNLYQKQGVYAKRNKVGVKFSANDGSQNENCKQVAFKGGKGGAIGIVAGAALGALGAAAIIATGGLAGVVAAVGYGSTVAAGAASCTHLGGIAGSIIEDHLGDDKKK